MEFKTVTIVFLIFLMAKEIIEFFLDLKNRSYVMAHRDAVPDKFKDQVSLEEHQKAADYTVAKIKIGQVFNFINFFVLLAWTLGGGFELLDRWVRGLEMSSLYTGLIFIFAYGGISLLIGLPQSLYSTFVLEEKFGFNKTTPAIFIKDMIKGLLLGVIIGAPLMALILWIMPNPGDVMSKASYWWLWAWSVLTAFQLIMLWAYPVLIAPLFNKFSPMEEGDVKNKVLALLDRTGFTSNGLFVMDASMRSSHGNAYFTGFGKNKRIVFFDTLIKTLDAGEVESVLAHELGHYKRKHVLKGLIKAMLLSLVGFFILGKVFTWLPFYQGHGVTLPSDYMALLLFSMVSGIYTFFLTPLNAFVSRKYEFEADQFASENASASKLITALVKLYKDNASTLTPDPTYSAYYYSHPPALERVKFLEKLSSNG
ncbi:MAG: M48 family peptidase [Epsilonproteobacteria bacterium]|nr:MAG: M48 family peptidase [Campylobacterota bacterium]RLA64502.1 MAG: M48 family peptidase [Campylobacterota bacterium]